MGKPSSSQVSTSSGPPAAFINAYTDTYNQAKGLTQQPYQQYGGPMVAGFSPDQLAAFGTIQNSQGLAQPYYNQAASYMNSAATPISPMGFDINGGDYTQFLPQVGADYLTYAGQMAEQASAPISLMDYNIDPYLSPYTEDVTNALSNTFAQNNATQYNQIRGNAAAQGAFGGDREAVAEAQTAQQQDLAQQQTLAGVSQAGFAQAQQEFNAQQAADYQRQVAQKQYALGAGQLGLGIGQDIWGEFNTQQQQDVAAQEASAYLQAQAGSGLANLGNLAQNSALSGAQAQMTAGGMQQQLEQQLLNVPYYQFMQQQAYPYQQLGWLANIAEGLGGASGGTSSTTYPGPSAISQLGGLATAGAGVYGLGSQQGWWGSSPSAADFNAGLGMDYNPWAADGGAIKRASGGSLGVPPEFGGAGIPGLSDSSYIPGASGMGSAPASKSGGMLHSAFMQPVTTQTQSGGGGGLGDIVSLGLKIAPMFLANGGVPRGTGLAHGYASGGGPHAAAPIVADLTHIAAPSSFAPPTMDSLRPAMNFAPSFDASGYPGALQAVPHGSAVPPPLSIPMSNGVLNRAALNPVAMPAGVAATETPAPPVPVYQPSLPDLSQGGASGGHVGHGGIGHYDGGGMVYPNLSQGYIPTLQAPNRTMGPPAPPTMPGWKPEAGMSSQSILDMLKAIKGSGLLGEAMGGAVMPPPALANGGRMGLADGGWEDFEAAPHQWSYDNPNRAMATSPQIDNLSRYYPDSRHLRDGTGQLSGSVATNRILYEHGLAGMTPIERSILLNPSFPEGQMIPRANPATDAAFAAEREAQADRQIGGGRENDLLRALGIVRSYQEDTPTWPRVGGMSDAMNWPQGSMARGGGLADGGFPWEDYIEPPPKRSQDEGREHARPRPVASPPAPRNDLFIVPMQGFAGGGSPDDAAYADIPDLALPPIPNDVSGVVEQPAGGLSIPPVKEPLLGLAVPRGEARPPVNGKPLGKTPGGGGYVDGVWYPSVTAWNLAMDKQGEEAYGGVSNADTPLGLAAMPSVTSAPGGTNGIVPRGTEASLAGPAIPPATPSIDQAGALVRRHEAEGVAKRSGISPYSVGYGGVDLSTAPTDDYGFPQWGGASFTDTDGKVKRTHAAGAYQFQPATWQKYAAPLGIHDFSQESQDKVFAAAYKDQGFAPWAPFNSSLRAAIGRSDQVADPDQVVAGSSGLGAPPLTKVAATSPASAGPNSDIMSKIDTILKDIGERGKSGSDLYKSPYLPLIAAGLGMMASRSPFPGVAIGEGGLAGIKALQHQQSDIPKNDLERVKAAEAQMALEMMPIQAGIASGAYLPASGGSTPVPAAGAPATVGSALPSAGQDPVVKAPGSAPSPGITQAASGTPDATVAGAAPATSPLSGRPVPSDYGQPAAALSPERAKRIQMFQNLDRQIAIAQQMALMPGPNQAAASARVTSLLQSRIAAENNDPQLRAEIASAEAWAKVDPSVREATMKAYGTLKPEVLKAIASQLGRNVIVHPGEVATTGAQIEGIDVAGMLGIPRSGGPGTAPPVAGAAPSGPDMTPSKVPPPASRFPFATPENLSPDSSLAAPQVRLTPAPGGGMTAAPTIPGLKEYQAGSGKLAEDTQKNIPKLTAAAATLEMQHQELVSAAGAKNFFAPGAFNEARVRVGTIVNTLADLVGKPDMKIDPTHLGESAAIGKAGFSLASEAVHDISARPSQLEFQSAGNSVPNNELPAFSALLLSNTLAYQNAYKQGQSTYILDQYKKGVDPAMAAQAYQVANGDRVAGTALARTYIDMAVAQPTSEAGKWVSRLLSLPAEKRELGIKQFDERSPLKDVKGDPFKIKSWGSLITQLAGS